MPLNQNEHDDQSWGTLSEGWPSTKENHYAKYVFANKSRIIPYGTYVSMDDHLRVENTDLLKKLNENFNIVREAILNESST